MSAEIISLPHKIYDETIKDIVERSLNSSIDNFKVICSTGSKKGEGYVGMMYRVEILDKVTNDIKLSVIVKASPQNEVRRHEFMINEFFGREATFYNQIYPLYKKFQVEKGIDIQKDGFHNVPHCYKTLTEDPHEALFLEDLKLLGFEMFDRFKELTKDHVFLVMKTLAKMHAIFFVLKDLNLKAVEKYLDIQDILIFVNENRNSSIDTWFENIKVQAYDVVKNMENKDMQTRVKKHVEKSLSETFKYCFDKENFGQYATICHGDCWNNNMMFQYDQNGTPVVIRLLDFQIFRYASPVCDLMYYIFSCTSKKLRDEYYQDFLDIYFHELTTFIERLGSNPEKLFPREIFDAHLQKFGHFGLTMALMVLPFFTSDPEDTPDMDEFAGNLRALQKSEEVDEKAFKMANDESFNKYAERLLGVCHDMYRLGYI